MKYFWKLHYLIAGEPKHVGKSNYMKYMARINGWKIIELRVAKVNLADFEGQVKWTMNT